MFSYKKDLDIKRYKHDDTSKKCHKDRWVGMFFCVR